MNLRGKRLRIVGNLTNWYVGILIHAAFIKIHLMEKEFKKMFRISI